MNVDIPAVRISTEGLGTLYNFYPTRMSLSGSIFQKGSASISGIEKAGSDGTFYDVRDLGGLWQIYFDNGTSEDLIWQGYMMDVDSTRKYEVYERSFSLVDMTEAWDILLTDSIFPSTANSSYTIGDLIKDLADGAVAGSGINYNFLVSDSTLLSDVLNNDFYTVRDSSYLAELNKVLLWMGYKLYADPLKGKISIISPVNTATFGTTGLSFSDPSTISASFKVDYSNMATTVVVGDDVSGKAVSYGHLGGTPDSTNYDLRKIEKPAFVTTYNVKDAKLSDIAKQVFDLSRQGAQKLKVVKAGYYTNSILWNEFDWTDANGGLGTYKITDYIVEISNTIQTTVEAIL